MFKRFVSAIFFILTLSTLYCADQTADITIYDAIDMALGLSLSSRQNNLMLKRLELEINTAWLRPIFDPTSLSLSVSGGYNQTNENSSIGINIGVSHNIDMNSITDVYKTVLDWQNGQITYDKAKGVITGSVIKSYLKIILLKQRIDFINETIRQAKIVFDNISDQYRRGYVSEIQKLKSELNYLTLIPDLESLNSSYKNEINNFRFITGIDENCRINFLTQIPDFAIENITMNNSMIDQNIDLAYSRMAEKIAQNILTDSIFNMIPSLRVQYSMNTSSGLNGGDNVEFSQPANSFSLSLSIPLDAYLPFSTEHNSIISNRYKLEESRLSTQIKIQRLLIDIDALINKINSQRDKLTMLSINREIANRTFLLVQNEYNLGNVSIDDLIETKNDLNEIEFSIMSAKSEILNTIVDLDLIINNDFEFFRRIIR